MHDDNKIWLHFCDVTLVHGDYNIWLDFSDVTLVLILENHATSPENNIESCELSRKLSKITQPLPKNHIKSCNLSWK